MITIVDTLLIVDLHPWTSIFRAWKTRIDLILAKNKVLDIVKVKIVEPIDNARKEKFKEDGITAICLIVDSIRDYLIPYVSKLENSKAMYDALTNLFTINNIGLVMSLKNELCDVRMTNDDIVASYFVRISQLRCQLQSIDEVIKRNL